MKGRQQSRLRRGNQDGGWKTRRVQGHGSQDKSVSKTRKWTAVLKASKRPCVESTGFCNMGPLVMILEQWWVDVGTDVVNWQVKK